jgi:hypothetical protein
MGRIAPLENRRLEFLHFELENNAPTGEVWQRGFSEVRITDPESLLRHREYILRNPVRAGLVETPEEFRPCFTYLARTKAAGA